MQQFLIHQLLICMIFHCEFDFLKLTLRRALFLAA
jgi:hypothetical protein